jgi:hypothetical protein
MTQRTYFSLTIVPTAHDVGVGLIMNKWQGRFPAVPELVEMNWYPTAHAETAVRRLFRLAQVLADRERASWSQYDNDSA